MTKSLQISLDEVFSELDLDWPNKIKVDVDGNEETVLRGMKNLLARAEEIYFEDSGTKACSTFVEFLASLGFIEFSHVEIFSTDGKGRSNGFNRIFKK